MKIVVTGGAGFIGSELVRQLATDPRNEILVIDKLTYAGSRESLPLGERCSLAEIDLKDAAPLKEIICRWRPQEIYHLAAETHVDRSISSPEAFLQSNIVGTFNLLQACRVLLDEKHQFRLLSVSTDEVYGALTDEEAPFTTESPYRPNSPYAASKAAGDHLVRAWSVTYGLPVITTHCSNNYGPWQASEKLIPLTIRRALMNESIPVYGDGRQIRDWLHVSDHVRGLILAMKNGNDGETYNFGASNEVRNIDLVSKICSLLDDLRPGQRPARNLISFVDDRPGHDFRYALDDRSSRKLGWSPQVSFENGLHETVRWFAERTR